MMEQPFISKGFQGPHSSPHLLPILGSLSSKCKPLLKILPDTKAPKGVLQLVIFWGDSSARIKSLGPPQPTALGKAESPRALSTLSL